MRTLSENFFARYEIIRATSEELIRESQRLRYKVFCAEKSVFDKDNFLEGLEKDEFDRRSVHDFIRSKKTGMAVASVRLVLADTHNEEAVFPVEKHCGEVMVKGMASLIPFSRRNLAEISRFAVSTEGPQTFGNGNVFIDRRGGFEKVIPGEDRRIVDCRRSIYDRRVGPASREESENSVNSCYRPGNGRVNTCGERTGRRFFSYLTLGLARAVMEMAADKNVTHLYACMEPALCRLLTKYAIFFKHLGPPVNYFGMRQPCFAVIDELLDRVSDERRDIWDFITDGGRLCSLPPSCYVNRG